jgi:hypothetical protein
LQLKIGLGSSRFSTSLIRSPKRLLIVFKSDDSKRVLRAVPVRTLGLIQRGDFTRVDFRGERTLRANPKLKNATPKVTQREFAALEQI